MFVCTSSLSRSQDRKEIVVNKKLEKEVRGLEMKGRDVGWKAKQFLNNAIEKTGFRIGLMILGGLFLVIGIMMSFFFKRDK